MLGLLNDRGSVGSAPIDVLRKLDPNDKRPRKGETYVHFMKRCQSDGTSAGLCEIIWLRSR